MEKIAHLKAVAPETITLYRFTLERASFPFYERKQGFIRFIEMCLSLPDLSSKLIDLLNKLLNRVIISEGCETIADRSLCRHPSGASRRGDDGPGPGRPYGPGGRDGAVTAGAAEPAKAFRLIIRSAAGTGEPTWGTPYPMPIRPCASGFSGESGFRGYGVIETALRV